MIIIFPENSAIVIAQDRSIHQTHLTKQTKNQKQTKKLPKKMGERQSKTKQQIHTGSGLLIFLI